VQPETDYISPLTNPGLALPEESIEYRRMLPEVRACWEISRIPYVAVCFQPGPGSQDRSSQNRFG